MKNYLFHVGDETASAILNRAVSSKHNEVNWYNSALDCTVHLSNQTAIPGDHQAPIQSLWQHEVNCIQLSATLWIKMANQVHSPSLSKHRDSLIAGLPIL